MTKAKKGSSKKAARPKLKKREVSTSSFFNKKLHTAIIFLFAFILYGNTLFHDFTLDDSIVITENDFTQAGLSGIPKILSKDTFVGFFGEEKDLVAGGRYRPLSLVTFAMEYQIFGLNPRIGHLGNILLYGLTGFLLYLILMRLFPAKTQTQRVVNMFITLGTTFLFMAHPLHTEVVANIKGRDEIMCLLGSLGGLLLILKSYQEKKPNLAIWAGVVFFLGLMSKENAITFLAVVPLTFYFFTKANTKEILGHTFPFLIATVAFILIRTAVLGLDFGDSPRELMNNPYLKLEGSQYVPFSAAEKLSTVTYSAGRYAQLLVAPVTLTHDYYPKHIDLMPWSDWRVLLSLFFYLGLIAFALIKLKSKHLVAYGIIFFVATFSIVSNVIFPIGTHMSERFMYMPSIGFSLIVVWLLYLLGTKIIGNASIKDIKQLGLPIGILAVVIGLFSFKTVVRNQVWKDNYTLFTTDAHTSTQSAKIQNAAGGEIISKAINDRQNALKKLNGITDPAQLKAQEAPILAQFKNDVSTAVPHLNQAIKIHPGYANAFLLLGNAHNYMQKYDESIQYFQKAKQLKNPYEEADKNIGQTYLDGGKYFGEVKNNFPKAITYLNEAVKYNNVNKNEANRLLGLCYASSGQIDKGIQLLEGVIKNAPKEFIYYDNLAAFYGQRGAQTGNPADQARAAELKQKANQLKNGNQPN